jgi:Helix-turn-helix domain
MATMQLELTAAPVAEPAAVLTEKDVARMLNLSRDTVRAMQLSHDGPAYTQFTDGRIRYRMADVLKFQALRAAAHKRLMASYGAAQ